MNKPWIDDQDDDVQPEKKARKKKVEPEIKGIVPWSKIEFKEIDTDKFAKQMKDAGIITYQDVLNNRNIIFSILQNLYGIDVATIRSFARGYKKE